MDRREHASLPAAPAAAEHAEPVAQRPAPPLPSVWDIAMAQSLRKIREHAGLSIEQLAAKTDVDAATLAGYERGDGVSELRLDRAIRISGACGVRLEIAPFT